MEIIIIKR